MSANQETTDTILRILGEHSSDLEDIKSIYTPASAEIEAVQFYEKYPTQIVDDFYQQIAPHYSAIVAGDRQAAQEMLHADHFEMVKFQHSGDVNYVAVLSYLQLHVEGANEAVTKKWRAEDAFRDLTKGAKSSSQELGLPKPFPELSRNYVDRPEAQSLITHNLLQIGPTINQSRCVLYGMAGGGKTQLATKWMQENKSSNIQLEKDLELPIRCLGSEYGKAMWKDAVAYLGSKEWG